LLKVQGGHMISYNKLVGAQSEIIKSVG